MTESPLAHLSFFLVSSPSTASFVVPCPRNNTIVESTKFVAVLYSSSKQSHVKDVPAIGNIINLVELVDRNKFGS